MTNILLSHEGVISGTDELFVHTLCVETADTDLALISSDAMTAFQVAWNASGTDISSMLGVMVNYTGVAAAQILSLLNNNLSAAVRTPFVPPAPVGTGVQGPLQVSVAVSLTAGTRPNGTPLRGRFYMPPLSEVATADAVVSPLYQGRLATFVEAWFVELNARGLAPSVWSREYDTIGGVTSGAVQPVSAARVGRVPDTIRSRRNGLAEAPYVDITV